MSGITSGVSRSAVTTPLPRNGRRESAIEARTPSATAMTLENAATIALVLSAACISPFVAKSRYQLSVKPLSGNVGTDALLNEKTSRIAIGA